MSNAYGRQVVVPLVNKSGGSVAAGDVVVIDTTNNEAFTTSTAGAVTGGVGIAQETIASNATGRVLMHGYAALVNVNASVTRGNYGKTHTVVKQATDAGSSRVAGAFCQFLTGGTTPTARVYSPDLAAAAGNVAADAIWDAKGDLAAATGADAAAKVTVGTDGHVLTADSAQTTGLKYSQPAGTILGYNIDTSGDHTTGGTSLADVDATNAKVTFTVPASGKVIVRITGSVSPPATTANAYVTWGLRESSSDVAGAVGESIAVRASGSAAGSGEYCGAVKEFYFTGLTPGASKTYKWSHACSSGNGILKANASSPAIMTVIAL